VPSTPSVNPVDAIFAAFPGYLYLNPKLGEYVLRPLLLYQSSNYSQPYAAMDLGKDEYSTKGRTMILINGIRRPLPERHWEQ
jgi:hypothetical protein